MPIAARPGIPLAIWQTRRRCEMGSGWHEWPLMIFTVFGQWVVMPLRYLWVFVAFIAVVRLAQKYKPEYVFIRNKPLAMTVGIWCFAFTAFACLTGIFPKMEAFTAEWTFQLALNVATPFVLVGLGLIFPLLARKANSK
ncbi:DmsC/YnfH family molybdoenzyme membrane anchor subunit [Escherichia coli]|uniref:DmsC/YnfH family molybdoenzyme membrane anchor subunit n=1 Tax=Escherichia coli TaxID=562 RepID=UPI0024DF2B95|nr:DmsC/YnfH family molybdoenzyme membrane anchor subunit [Escherichia coli]